MLSFSCGVIRKGKWYWEEMVVLFMKVRDGREEIIVGIVVAIIVEVIIRVIRVVGST